MPVPDRLPDGLYESVRSTPLEERLRQDRSRIAEFAKVDDADQVHVLTRYVSEQLHVRLSTIKKADERLSLINDLLAAIDGSEVLTPVELLHRLSAQPAPGAPPRYAMRPKTPLNDVALLTNAHGEPSLASEVRAELSSADSVDLVCAFVMWHGLRLTEDDLREVAAAGVPIRVITTTYIGGTERRALDRLVEDFGAQVKVQYDSQRTRLHAKAWLFGRHSGFETAYVGSSNLTTAAMLEGVEWNVRLSTAATPSLMTKFRATFDSYWNSPEYEDYLPERDRDRLDDALLEAKGVKASGRVTISLVGLEVRPYPFQAEMLAVLDAERVLRDRHRNLIVAATGTGKTVVAALDYRSLSERAGGLPSLLFVAHRTEILEQSLRMYREVLGDGSFGELYVGGRRPERWKHVFASVQALTAYGVASIPPDAFEVVVIDEFHHAEAPTYRRILDHLRPVELLGLTATPERTDGTDVRSFFEGRTAAELRLWDALGADLLCPFHYFAVADGTDLRSVPWSRGRYDEPELDNLFTGNDARARIVLRQVRDKISDLGQMRALGFCVSVAHASYMTRVFTEAGIPSALVIGATPAPQRASAIRDLRDARVNVLFTVDVFNEGLDIPDVDTILFLRPTESATVFMQQLGRGLRRTHRKAVLTVLDFVGYHRAEFRFANRLQAMTGLSGKQLQKATEEGFPFLPSGSQILLDRQAQQILLENLRSQIVQRWITVVSELRRQGDVDLATFLDCSGLNLSDVLKGGQRSWTQLRQQAGLDPEQITDAHVRLLRRMRAFAHVDDPVRVGTYRRLLAQPMLDHGTLSPLEQRLARMLFFSLRPDGDGHQDARRGLRELVGAPAVRAEIAAIVDLSYDAARHVSYPLSGALDQIPLRVHARYQREEILAALDFPRAPNSMREGVVHLKESGIDAFLITLKKSEADYSPSTMHADYPISRRLFHWESQSTTSVSSATGQRYLSGTSTVLLFARQQQRDEFGTSPYLFLGPASYVSHTGDRPIAITWRLERELPVDFFTRASAVAP